MTSEPKGTDGSYSEIADEQLDALEAGNPSLYNDVLTVCELIFNDPGRAQSMSAEVRAERGVVFRLAVPGRHPYKVFWTSDGPRIEAIFPYE